MKLSKEHIERLREMLARPGQRIVVVSHTNPDGDAVGSSLAWAEVLRTMGHAVTCVVPNKYPYFLDWMPGIDEVVIFKTDTEGRARRAIAAFGVCVYEYHGGCCSCHGPGRVVGQGGAFSGLPREMAVPGSR